MLCPGIQGCNGIVQLVECVEALQPNVERTRLYEGEGHDVQYRHLDQVYVDMAGMANKLVVCRNGRTKLVKEGKAERLVAEGRATLGICAWTQPDPGHGGKGDDD